MKSAISNASLQSKYDLNTQDLNGLNSINSFLNNSYTSNNNNNQPSQQINNKSHVEKNETKEPKRKSRSSRAKTAVFDKSKKNKETNKDKDDYEHRFYSNSWRIHSEFAPQPRNGPMDATHTHFYCVGKKIPETFIFHPDWV